MMKDLDFFGGVGSDEGKILRAESVSPFVSALHRFDQVLSSIRSLEGIPVFGDGMDISVLMRLTALSSAESRQLALGFEIFIRQRWDGGDFVRNCDPNSLDLSVFERIDPVQYEFMPTRVAPGAVEGGLGMLFIQFPAGAKEAEIPHTHPGGRIIVPFGPGVFHCKALPGGRMDIKPGMVILMPKDTVHNFAATDYENMDVLSFHVGYRDVLSPDAIRWVD